VDQKPLDYEMRSGSVHFDSQTVDTGDLWPTHLEDGNKRDTRD